MKLMQAKIPETATRKEKILFALRAIVFAVLLAALLSYTLYVLVPKYDYGICSITNLYQQEDDTVDVLVLGTSLAYGGVNTNVLWEEYGIAAYNLCGAEQPYWISYYYLQEALKTQHPQVIVLDAKPATYPDDYSRRGRAFLGTTGIKDPIIRLRALLSSVAPENYASFVAGFPQLHSYYPDVTLDNFAYPPNNGGRGFDWEGYIESTETEVHSKPSLVWSSTKKNVNPRQVEYFRKTVELAQRENIPVMVIGIPNPDYANDHMYYNTLWEVADEYGVPHVNYNDPTNRYGLLYSSCFSDWQHLNVKGSVIFSRKLGADLKEMFPLPDRRLDEGYDAWRNGSEAWYETYPEYLPEKPEEGAPA